MPTYQYACTACDEQLEVVQKFSDDSLTECPTCGGRLRKIYSAVGVVFKGSGFYRTDSREATAAKNGSANGSGSESTKESKPATTSDAPAKTSPSTSPAPTPTTS